MQVLLLSVGIVIGLLLNPIKEKAKNCLEEQSVLDIPEKAQIIKPKKDILDEFTNDTAIRS